MELRSGNWCVSATESVALGSIEPLVNSDAQKPRNGCCSSAIASHAGHHGNLLGLSACDQKNRRLDRAMTPPILGYRVGFPRPRFQGDHLVWPHPSVCLRREATILKMARRRQLFRKPTQLNSPNHSHLLARILRIASDPVVVGSASHSLPVGAALGRGDRLGWHRSLR